jgi:phosphatidylserine/phosphatidylglycerophosphate/cardiolipin synthase-like enzyme
VRLIVQPQDGVAPVLKAIRKARRSIDMHIFRLDSKDVEKALAAAVARGVVVRTLVAHTNARGEKALRKLEQRLLELGASVSRTADDLVRYHGKMMIVDESLLLVMSFNLTKLDLERCRSLGIATRKRELVQEGLRLFAADFDRKPYTGGAKDFLVSPVNARERLAVFLAKAKRQLLVYDESVTDDAMIGILKDRKKAGVELRVIGKVEKGHGLEAEPFPGKRQHLRCVVRDGRAAFVGSQSLRKPELDTRREIGIVARDARLVRAITKVFDEDWSRTEAGRKQASAERDEAREKDKEREADARGGKSEKHAAGAAGA